MDNASRVEAESLTRERTGSTCTHIHAPGFPITQRVAFVKKMQPPFWDYVDAGKTKEAHMTLVHPVRILAGRRPGSCAARAEHSRKQCEQNLPTRMADEMRMKIRGIQTW